MDLLCQQPKTQTESFKPYKGDVQMSMLSSSFLSFGCFKPYKGDVQIHPSTLQNIQSQTFQTL